MVFKFLLDISLQRGSLPPVAPTGHSNCVGKSAPLDGQGAMNCHDLCRLLNAFEAERDLAVDNLIKFN
jgi:hypothetical protein